MLLKGGRSMVRLICGSRRVTCVGGGLHGGRVVNRNRQLDLSLRGAAVPGSHRPIIFLSQISSSSIVERAKFLIQYSYLMGQDAKEILLSEFHRVVERKLRHHSDVQVAPADPQEIMDEFCRAITNEEDAVSALMRINGEVFSCTMAIFTSVAMVFSVSAAQVTNATDWVGELANVLMGALKNRLSEFHVGCRLALPVAERGLQRRFTACQGDQAAIAVRLDTEVLVIVLDYCLDPQFPLVRDPSLATPEDGEICLF